MHRLARVCLRTNKHDGQLGGRECHKIKPVIYLFLQKVYDSVIDWTIVGCVYTGVSCPELLLAAWLWHARIIGLGIRFKLQMLCPQEDE